MTVSSGFFNSVNHDRLYNAEQLSSIFDGIILDGVYEAYGDAFKVVANSDVENSVIVGTGRAWFDHTWTLNDSQAIFSVSPPNEMLDRYDAICIDVDRRETVRSNSLVVVNGALGSPAQYPTLIDEDLHKQYPIAYVKRTAGGSSTVTNSDIEIKIGSEDCPLVTGILDAMNTDMYVQQLNADFNTWWDGIKDLIGENPVLNLQNQIDEINDKNTYQDNQINRINQKVFAFEDGRDLGTSITDDQHAKIAAGNFSDFLPGDYWTLNGTKYRIVGYDSFLGLGETDESKTVTDHHLVLAPDFSITMNDINETFKVHNRYGNNDELSYVVSGMLFGGQYYSYNNTLFATNGDNSAIRTKKIYYLPISRYMNVSEDSLAKISSDLGDSAIEIPQAIPSLSLQNFEVAWSKAIIPYDFQIKPNTSGSSYYNAINDLTKVEWLRTHPEFYFGVLGYRVPTTSSGSFVDDNNSQVPYTYLTGDKEYSQTLFTDNSGRLRGYIPSYIGNPLFSKFYKSLIDPIADEYYKKLDNSISSIDTGNNSYHVRGCVNSTNVGDDGGYNQWGSAHSMNHTLRLLYSVNRNDSDIHMMQGIQYYPDEVISRIKKLLNNINTGTRLRKINDYVGGVKSLNQAYGLDELYDVRSYNRIEFEYTNQYTKAVFVPLGLNLMYMSYGSGDPGRDWEGMTTINKYECMDHCIIFDKNGGRFSVTKEASDSTEVDPSYCFYRNISDYTGSSPVGDEVTNKNHLKAFDHVRLKNMSSYNRVLALCAIK